MPKEKTYKKYTPKFKVMVVETMHKEGLSYREAAKQFDVSTHRIVANWDRIYIEEGKEALSVERRGQKWGYPAKLMKKDEKDLVSQIQRLRAENAYLKKLNALVQKRKVQERKKK
jgi:transposase-like protein